MRVAQTSPIRILHATGPMPRGLKGFQRIMQERRCFVDKTLFIAEMFNNDDQVVLITRPRRFGKTTNLSMLQTFLQNSLSATDNVCALFAQTLIAEEGAIMQHQGQYPVIALTLKDVKETSWEEAHSQLCQLLRQEIERHVVVEQVDVACLLPSEQQSVQRILQDNATQNDWKSSLALLCKLLTLHYKQAPWLLLDEYDSPIHTAYVHTDKAVIKRPHDPKLQDGWRRRLSASYYGKMVNFMRRLLGEALKDNDDYLHKAVITGILRVAKENIFSGVNNLGTYGLLQAEFQFAFGFIETEVEQLLASRNLLHRLPDIRHWYNGYCFGEEAVPTVYNPWSIVSFLVSKTNRLEPYWANTSSNELIHSLIDASRLQDKQNMEKLLLGEVVTKDVSETLALQDLQLLPDTLYSILLCSGYLTPQQTKVGGAQSTRAHLRIPNEEIHMIYQRLVQQWFAKSSSNPLPDVLQALQQGNLQQFAQHLHQLSEVTLSYFDVAQQPEWFYHALVLGMVAYMNNTHFVRSNRESGTGRPDILLIPRDDQPLKPAIVMEIKQAPDSNTLEAAAQAGLQQIVSKNYAAIFHDHRTSDQFAVAIAFCGKQAAMRYQKMEP
ncbi:MAG: AAA family ATPase [Myxococcota bacterium]